MPIMSCIPSHRTESSSGWNASRLCEMIQAYNLRLAPYAPCSRHFRTTLPSIYNIKTSFALPKKGPLAYRLCTSLSTVSHLPRVVGSKTSPIGSYRVTLRSHYTSKRNNVKGNQATWAESEYIVCVPWHERVCVCVHLGVWGVSQRHWN